MQKHPAWSLAKADAQKSIMDVIFFVSNHTSWLQIFSEHHHDIFCTYQYPTG